MTTITRVDIHVFGYEVENLALPPHGAAGVGNLVWQQGGRMPMSRYAVTIDTADGARGEYVTHWVGTPASLGQTLMLAPHLIGRDPDSRVEIWEDLKREIRAYDHMGHGPHRHRALGPRRQAAGGVGRADAGRLPEAPADLCQHLSRPGPEGRPRHARGLRRLCRRLQGAGLRRLQDPRLARRQCQARDRKPAGRAQGRRRRLVLDDRSGLSATDLDGRPQGRPGLRRGRLFLVRGPLSRRRRVCRGAKAPAREAGDTDPRLRACPHHRAEGGVPAGRRLRHDPRRSRIRHGHHRGHEDRPFLRGASASTSSSTPAARHTGR